MEPRIVTRDEWNAARKELLLKEKELTHMADRLRAERLAMPWVKIETEYSFDDAGGKVTLADLFDGRSQLFVYHFMFGPDWNEGCIGCSFLSDHLDGAVTHLRNHDVSYVAVSRAPIAEIEAFKRRMGWRFRWVSSFGTPFNYDFGVSFTPEQIASGKVYYNYELRNFVSEELQGASVFYRNAKGEIFHTYSSYARGLENALGAYSVLDVTPMGRNETGATHSLADWVRHHDRYDQNDAGACAGHPEHQSAPCHQAADPARR